MGANAKKKARPVRRKRGPVRLTAAVTREGRLYVAQCLEVDVASQGTSLEGALTNLREALELLLEDAGVEVRPAPIIAPVEVTLS